MKIKNGARITQKIFHCFRIQLNNSNNNRFNHCIYQFNSYVTLLQFNQIWCLDYRWKALMFSFYLLSKSLKLLNLMDIYNQILLAWYFLSFHPWIYCIYCLCCYFCFNKKPKTPKVMCYPSVMSRITLVAWNTPLATASEKKG